MRAGDSGPGRQSLITHRLAGQGEECALETLDLAGNRLGRLPELAVLAGCPRLRELRLSCADALVLPAACGAASAGWENPVGSENPICGLSSLRGALAAALPQLRALDGVELAGERRALPRAADPGAAAQVCSNASTLV